MENFRDEVVYQNAGKGTLGTVFCRGHLKTSCGLSHYRVLPHFALVYILAGSGFYQTASEPTQKVGRGDALLLYPGVPHRYGPTTGDAGWSEIYLLFGGPIFDQWMIHGVLGPKTSLLHADPIDYWARRITEILPPGTDLRLSTLASLQTVCQLQSLLADLLANDHPPTAERDAAWFEQACALLEELPFRGQAAVARQLGTTADCFRKRFQKIAGVAPSHYRKAHLIDQACAMLQENRLRDHEIADALGFHDAAHFSKYFKAHNGQTPTAFRRAQPVTPR